MWEKNGLTNCLIACLSDHFHRRWLRSLIQTSAIRRHLIAWYPIFSTPALDRSAWAVTQRELFARFGTLNACFAALRLLSIFSFPGPASALSMYLNENLVDAGSLYWMKLWLCESKKNKKLNGIYVGVFWVFWQTDLVKPDSNKSEMFDQFVLDELNWSVCGSHVQKNASSRQPFSGCEASQQERRYIGLAKSLNCLEIVMEGDSPEVIESISGLVHFGVKKK